MKKRNLVIFLIAVLFTTMVFMTACKPDEEAPPSIETYTVTFSANGVTDATNIPAALTEVEEDSRITRPTPDPSSPTHEFLGWYKDADGGNVWNFDTDKVVADVTLYAKWSPIAFDPTNVQKMPFSNSISFLLRDAASSDVFEVKFNDTVIAGTATVTGTKVVWTPSTAVTAGTYTVVIKTTRAGANINPVTLEDVVYFDIVGEGTEATPYEISNTTQLYEITRYQGEVGQGQHFLLKNDLTVDSNIGGSVFLGSFDGDSKKLSIDASKEQNKYGIFHKIGENAVVKNLSVEATDALTEFMTGTLADSNAGKIDNVKNAARLEKRSAVVFAGASATPTYAATYGTANDLNTLDLGGLGGIVRLNEQTGIIINSSNSGRNISADIGAGGIAGINYGLIEKCTNSGVTGAYSLSTNPGTVYYHSYTGGIAGVNYGTIKQCRNSSAVRSNHSVGSVGGAQLTADQSAVAIERSQKLGSIAGYNAPDAVITESVGASGVIAGHSHLGGIVGRNLGTVSYSYIEGDRMVNFYGTEYIGTIAGSNTGTVNSCYGIFNTVVRYDETKPVYAIAEGTVTNSVYTANPTTTTTLELTAPTGTTNVLAVAAAEPTVENRVRFFENGATVAATLNTTLSAGNEKFTTAGQLAWQVASVEVKFEAVYMPEVTTTSNLPSNYIAYVNEFLHEPVAPTTNNADYEFEGWYTDAACTTAAVFGERLTSSGATLYAKFIPIRQRYTVEFDNNGITTTSMPTEQTDLLDGDLIEEPANPTTTATKYFVGWSVSSTGTPLWNFETDTVSNLVADGDNVITLYAIWADTVNPFSNLSISSELFNNDIIFEYAGAANSFTVTIDDIEVTGTATNNGTTYTYTVNTADLPAYGTYTVVVSDGAENISGNLDFCGAGTELNPYAISTVDEFHAISRAGDGTDEVTVGTGKYYVLTADLSITTQNTTKAVFNGTFDGDGKSITSTKLDDDSAATLFYKIGANGVVKNLTNPWVSGTPKAPFAVFGAIACYNYGTIENCTTGEELTTNTLSAFITSDNLVIIETLVVDHTDVSFIAFGGIVGANFGTIKECKNYLRLNTFSVSGGIAGYNAEGATIEDCENFGRIGANGAAGNEFASFMGGIVALNLGEVIDCSLTYLSNSGSRGSVGGTNTSKSNNFYNGGIAAYNGETGTIDGCVLGADSAVGGYKFIGQLVGYYEQTSGENGTSRLTNYTTVGSILYCFETNGTTAVLEPPLVGHIESAPDNQ